MSSIQHTDHLDKKSNAACIVKSQPATVPTMVWQQSTRSHQKQGSGQSPTPSASVDHSFEGKCSRGEAAERWSLRRGLLQRWDGKTSPHQSPSRRQAIRRFKQALVYEPASVQHLSLYLWLSLAMASRSAEVQILNNIGLVYAKCQDYNGAYEWHARACKHIAVEVCRERRELKLLVEVRESSQAGSERCRAPI